MIERAPVCVFNCGELTPEQAQYKFRLFIPGFPEEQFAFIDSEGVIKNRYFITSYGRVFTSNGYELFPEYDYAHNDKSAKPYMRINLPCIDGRRRRVYIHRLVANAFIPKEPGKDIINHAINLDGRCNYVWNLEWCDFKENSQHYYNYIPNFDPHLYNFHYITDRRDIEVLKKVCHNRFAKFSDHQAMLICYAYTVKGYSLEDCIEYAWLDPTPDIIRAVYNILTGVSWTHISSKYGIIPKHK